MIHLILPLLFNVVLATDSGNDCAHCDPKKSTTDLIALKKEWWAVNSYRVENSPCTNSQNINEAFFNNYFNSKSSPLKQSEVIHGAKFIDENPELLLAFKKLTSVKGKNEITFDLIPTAKQKSYQLPPNCSKVICAVESIFGKGNGKRLLYLMDRYNLNGSHHVQKDSSAWKTDELNVLIDGLADLPDFLVKGKNRNTRFVKFERGYTYASYGPGVVANARMEFFDNWSVLPQSEKKSSAIHELGHRIHSDLGLDEHPKWLEMSGWKKLGSEWKSTKKGKIVSEYGETNPSEDFSETFLAYRYNPSYLKTVSPEKYQFLKEAVFLGIEFNQEKECRGFTPPVVSEAKSNESINLLFNQMNSCKSEFIELLRDNNTSSESIRCLTNMVKSTSYVEAIPKTLKHPKEFKKALTERYSMSEDGAPKSDMQTRMVAQTFLSYRSQLRDLILSFEDDRFSKAKDCSKWSESFSHEYDFFDKLFGEEGTAGVFHSQTLGSFGKRVCKKIFPDEKTNHKIDHQKLNDAITETFPKEVADLIKKEERGWKN